MEDYPGLRAAIETAERILEPAFEQADQEALHFQRLFRRAELAVIYGAVAAVGLALGAGLTPEGSSAGTALSLSEVLLTAVLGSLAFVSRGLRWHRKWLRRRWAAETLRAEGFLYIGCVGEYANAAERERVLQRRIVDIERLVRDPRSHA